jgi:hypothetical protein
VTDCQHCATYHEMASNLSAMHDRSHDAYALLTLNLNNLVAQTQGSPNAHPDLTAAANQIEKWQQRARNRLAQPLFNVRSSSKTRPAPTNEEVADQLGDLVKRVTAMHAEAVAYAELARSVQAGQLPLPAATD